MFETILVPLESSALDEPLLGQVQRLARHEDVRLVLLHVVDPEGGEEYGGADVHITLRCGSAERRLADLQKLLSEEGLEVSSKVMMGDPATVIVSQGESLGASVIALATHGRWGPKRWFEGSVSEAVLRNATVPVLVVNPGRATEGSTSTGFRRILVPLDGSERAAKILPHVRSLARLYESSVTLLRVGIHLPVPPLGPAPLGLDQLPSLRKAYRDVLRGYTSQLVGDVDVQVVFADTAANGVLETVDRGGYDLVALATHGRTGLDRVLFGSTAESIARVCTVPLLAWRDPDLNGSPTEGTREEQPAGV
jgi:nucleotide-binding universal stress UspA family protein